MPRSLALQIEALSIAVQDVRDIGLRGRPDTEVMQVAISTDAIIITRDRGFADPRSWPLNFTSGAIFVNLPSNTSARTVNKKVISVLSNRTSDALLGYLTTIETRRVLSRLIRSR